MGNIPGEEVTEAGGLFPTASLPPLSCVLPSYWHQNLALPGAQLWQRYTFAGRGPMKSGLRAAAHLENVLISFVCFFNLIIKCCLHMDWTGKACFHLQSPLPPWPACLPGESWGGCFSGTQGKTSSKLQKRVSFLKKIFSHLFFTPFIKFMKSLHKSTLKGLHFLCSPYQTFFFSLKEGGILKGVINKT